MGLDTRLTPRKISFHLARLRLLLMWTRLALSMASNAGDAFYSGPKVLDKMRSSQTQKDRYAHAKAKESDLLSAIDLLIRERHRPFFENLS